MNIGVLGELLSIILLTIAATLLDKDSSGNEIFKSVAILAVFIIGVFIIFRVVKVIFWWHPEWKNFLVPKYQDKDEKDIRTSMSIFFFMVALMYVLDIEIVFGAFVAGMFIATFFEHKKQLPHKLGTFGFGFLIPIFFIHVGSTLDIALLSMDLIVKAVIVTFIMIFVRVLSAQVFKTFLNFKEIILFALSHSMPLTLLIAIATLAHTGGAIDDFYYYVFVCASLFEVIISMSIIMLLGRSKITFSSFR
jgi:Kef-type K+ transport system membrane component KefB